MDKAQEKIAKYLHSLMKAGRPIAWYWEWDVETEGTKKLFLRKATNFLKIIKKLGYRKPVDRPELREKMEYIICGGINGDLENCKPEWCKSCSFKLPRVDETICKLIALLPQGGIMDKAQEKIADELLLTKEHRRKIIDTLSIGQPAVEALLKAQVIKVLSHGYHKPVDGELAKKIEKLVRRWELRSNQEKLYSQSPTRIDIDDDICFDCLEVLER